MTPFEELTKMFENLKEEFAKYEEKKSFETRKNVRKVLQSIKTEAQEFRKWMLNDFK